MEANRKRTQVHRLPTEDYTGIVLHGSGLDHFHNNPQSVLMAIEEIGGTPQHLYFTTDEEIKVGDWNLIYISDENGNEQTIIVQHEREAKSGLKIIATTDPKLTTTIFTLRNVPNPKPQYIGGELKTALLPQPSQALIKAYCEQGGFDEVDVEYEEATSYHFPHSAQVVLDNGKFKLKVDPIHNTITTHRIVEKMYSREEVEVKCKKALADGLLYRGNTKGKVLWTTYISDWIKENL
jgi:hypothetical protein